MIPSTYDNTIDNYVTVILNAGLVYYYINGVEYLPSPPLVAAYTVTDVYALYIEDRSANPHTPITIQNINCYLC